MASVASQVVFHPVVSQSIKLGSTTLGRDKLYRAVQYFARFYAWYLLRGDDKLGAARWTALKSHLAAARKLLRLGKPAEHIQAALRATISSGPAPEQITTIGRQVAYAAYLTYDAVVWANAVKFISLKPETAQRVAKTSNRFWLAGILLSLINSATKTVRFRNEAKKLQYSSIEKDVGLVLDTETKLKTLKTSQAAVRDQFILDVLDVWLPSTALGLTNLSEGVVGMFGLITSLLALQKQWYALGGK